MRALKYYTIAFLLKVVSLLPLGAAQRLGSLLGLLGWHCNTKSRQVTETNLAICFPELDEPARQQLARDSLRHTGKTLMEIPLMWEWPVEKCLELIREVEGLHLLDKVFDEKRGLILLAPHLGNWELAGLYFSSRYRMAALYSPPHIREFEEYMIKVRGRLGSELVRGDRRGLARLAGILREGGIAGILPDQSPRGKGNAFAPFFGMEVKTMTLVSKLMQRTGARALVTYAERLPGARGFRLVIRETEPGLDDSNSETAATALNRSIEDAVRLIPAQYQWEYKRLRHRPPGEINPYNPNRVC
ncbi:MAG: lysophospholipid acyltransferase family protein [Marinobacter sp.]|uniref:lysophospholipid acyltransferase family protein n=1 Tax=Marinobacter sp. TaxID=50741 RepID=UPI00299EB574|nr:lysophospholipid acyltransferase family protein [Marinobacter sp.]MDX1634983.1 lysophospholipid acyltransferase family protein [Marinobacter sp.]